MDTASEVPESRSPIAGLRELYGGSPTSDHYQQYQQHQHQHQHQHQQHVLDEDGAATGTWGSGGLPEPNMI